MRSTEELIEAFSRIGWISQRFPDGTEVTRGEIINRLAEQAAEIARLKAPWTEEEVEAAASTDYESSDGWKWEDAVDQFKSTYRDSARAALNAALAVRMGGDHV